MRKFFILAFAMLLWAGAPAQKFQPPSRYWTQRASLFDMLPVTQEDIVFLGNSITDGGEWAELLSDPRMKNRGISGDVVPGIIERLASVTDGKPAKIFLLIGINDVAAGRSVDKIASGYEKLVKEIRERSPETRLFLQSVMPIDMREGLWKNLEGKENMLPELNKRIKAIAEANGAVYIDLWPALADEEGRLRKEYSNDGLHLLGHGYLAWLMELRPYINEN